MYYILKLKSKTKASEIESKRSLDSFTTPKSKSEHTRSVTHFTEIVSHINERVCSVCILWCHSPKKKDDFVYSVIIHSSMAMN